MTDFAPPVVPRTGQIGPDGRHRRGKVGVGTVTTAAFVDAHVHATATGLALTGLALHDVTSLAGLLDRVEVVSRAGRGRVVLGTGWDDTGWPERRPPTRQELDRAAYGGAVYLARVDVHSAVVSSALLAATAGVRAEQGYDDSGHLRLDAHHAVRRTAYAGITPDQRRSAQRATRAHAASLGIGCLQEMSGPRGRRPHRPGGPAGAGRDRAGPGGAGLLGRARRIRRGRRAGAGRRRRGPVL